MQILYIDQWLMIVDKPSGLLSIQDGYDLTAPHVRTLLEPEFGRLWIVHRLDKDTSGTLMMARTKVIHRSLNILFESRKIKKEYRALIYGIPPDKEFTINLPLKVNADRQHRTRVDFSKGKPAQTSVQVLSSSSRLSYLTAEPHTGYTHQIRAHLSHIQHPVVGDLLYKSIGEHPCETNLPVGRMALHSHSLEFVHPITNQIIKVESPIPSFFDELMRL